MVFFEDLKAHIADVERCQQHPQTKSVPPVLFFRQSLRKWNPGTQTRRSPTREHHKQHRHPHPRCVSPSPHLDQFRHDLQQQAIPELHPDSRTLFAHLHKISLQEHKEVDRNGKMSSGRTYNWHSICLRWSDLLMQDHTFLRHCME